ncbi:MAG: hypothetical protein ACXABY_21555, partial [Candidatus Thorarchaeota archaeon]
MEKRKYRLRDQAWGITRRQFVRNGVITAAGLLIPGLWLPKEVGAVVFGGTPPGDGNGGCSGYTLKDSKDTSGANLTWSTWESRATGFQAGSSYTLGKIEVFI